MLAGAWQVRRTVNIISNPPKKIISPRYSRGEQKLREMGKIHDYPSSLAGSENEALPARSSLRTQATRAARKAYKSLRHRLHRGRLLRSTSVAGILTLRSTGRSTPV